jgi:hypothetical protein
MSQPTAIPADRFAERLTVLCVRNRLSNLPRQREDRLVLLKSIALQFDPQATYTERAVNEGIQQWTLTLGRRGYWDAVTLRRALVDEGLMTRDAAGSTYRVAPADTLPFAPDVDALDCVAVLAAAEVAVAERRARAIQTGD